MLKESINGFRIYIGEREYGMADTPISVIGALSLHGEIDDVYFGTNAKKTATLLSSGCTVSSDFRVDTVVYSQRRIMLALHRVDWPARVFVNGSSVAECDGRTSDYLFDVKKYLKIGENTVSIHFLGEHIDTAVSKWERLSRTCIGKCELVCFNDDIITEVGVGKEMCDGFVRLTVSVSTLEKSSSTRAVATIVSPGGRIYYCGLSEGRGSVDITEPNLWWPSSYGVQNLYKLSVNLYRDSEIVDSLDMRLGLAEIRVLPFDGEGMPTVMANGVPIFTRGACYMPDDMLLPYLDPTRVKKNLALLRETGSNTVLLRDFGHYPDDSFFKIADEEGLVIWSELSRDDIDELEAVIRGSMKKVSYHSSFGPVITKNDESAELVRTVIPDAQVIVVPNIDSLLIKSRESVPDEHTLLSITPPSELNVFSEELQYHTTLDDNISLIDSKDFLFPTGIRDVSDVTSYAECLSLTDIIEWKRRERRSDLGIILPRFNDPWPTISCSLVDYFGRRKPQHFALRRLFAPVMISASNDGTRVTFNVSNELKTEYSGKFSYSVITNKGEVLFRDSYDVTVAEREAMDILTIDLGEVVGGRMNECFVSYTVQDSFIITSKGILLFTSPRKFKFLEPTFQADISGSGTDFVLSISSDVPADKVHFDFSTAKAEFDENYIFIDDSSPRRIEFRTQNTTAVELLRRELKIRSLYDVGRNN